jgi:hypothetical protein
MHKARKLQKQGILRSVGDKKTKQKLVEGVLIYAKEITKSLRGRGRDVRARARERGGDRDWERQEL